jgi:hypothetical protein
LKEWIDDDNNVYIGRGGILFIDGERYPKVNSPFANPFKLGIDGTRDEVIQKYKAYITDKLEKSPALYSELLTMKGKNLGCWCNPEPCHGNVLLELLK